MLVLAPSDPAIADLAQLLGDRLDTGLGIAQPLTQGAPVRVKAMNAGHGFNGPQPHHSALGKGCLEK